MSLGNPNYDQMAEQGEENSISNELWW
jgi:hypothetical protein